MQAHVRMACSTGPCQQSTCPTWTHLQRICSVPAPTVISCKACCGRALKDRRAALPSAHVVLTGHGKAVPVYTDMPLIDFKVRACFSLLSCPPFVKNELCYAVEAMLCCACLLACAKAVTYLSRSYQFWRSALHYAHSCMLNCTTTA